jgi:hypothetical protein
MSRRYIISFNAVTVSAAQDLVLITGSSALKMIRILKQWVSCPDTALATGQGINIRSRFLPVTVTAGSGGTTGLTPTKQDQGDATCGTTTCGANNTTKATTNGTAVILGSWACHLYQGHVQNWEQDNVWVPIANTEAFVFELLSTVSGTASLSGGVLFEEYGG